MSFGQGDKGGARTPHPQLLGCLIALVAVLVVPVGSAAASQWTLRRLPPKPLEGGRRGLLESSITRHRRIKARFRFYSRDGARGFLCKRDRGRWRRCRSPLRYWVPIGHHVLRVRAIGPTGLRGPATSLGFEVMHPHRPLIGAPLRGAHGRNRDLGGKKPIDLLAAGQFERVLAAVERLSAGAM